MEWAYAPLSKDFWLVGNLFFARGVLAYLLLRDRLGTMHCTLFDVSVSLRYPLLH